MKPRRKRPAQKGGSDEPSGQDEALAAILLWSEAHKLVTALYDMAEKRPELFRLVARRTFYWPGFVSRKGAFKRKYDKLMDKIELGVDCPYSTKKWQLSAPTTQLAIKLHLLCCTYEKQWQLPPLTKKTKRLWFERGWKYWVNDLGAVPEKDPVLAKLGKSATRKRSGWDAKYRGGASDVRAEIKRQVRNAFNVLIG
jgi:hypothetical protein